MSRLRRIALTVAAMLAVLVLTMGYRLALSRGVFNSVEERTPGLCRTVPGVGAVADIAVDQTAKTAFIATSGALYAYADGKLTKLSGTPKDFHVRALATFGTGNEVLLRAVLAQAEGRFTIVLFKVSSGSVQEIGRITTDVLTDPAAIAMPDAERFYLVNRHDSHSSLGRMLDDVLLLPRAHLQWFDGMKFVAVAERLNTPSALALSADGAHLYIAQDYPRTITGMSRNDFTGAIGSPSALSLPSSPQKLTRAADGSLILAAIPKAGAGAVYRLRLENGLPKTTELLYAGTGLEVRAAAEIGATLLVGSSTGLLLCEVHR